MGSPSIDVRSAACGPLFNAFMQGAVPSLAAPEKFSNEGDRESRKNSQLLQE